MKVVALFLGVVGGVWGAMLGFWLAAVAGRLVQILGGGPGLFVAGIAALVLSIVGILGGGVAPAKPRAGGIMLLIGSAGMIILIALGAAHWVVIAPMLMLILAGVLALAASRRGVPAQQR